MQPRQPTMPLIDRRTLLAGAAGTAALAAAGFSGPALAQQGLKLGTAEAFSFEGLKARARDLAGKPEAAGNAPRKRRRSSGRRKRDDAGSVGEE